MLSFREHLRLKDAAAVVIGAAGSLAFLWRAGQGTPRFVFMLMSTWTLAPFAALLVAHSVPSPLRRRQRMLSVVTLLVVIASLAAYGLNLKPAGAPAGYLFVIIPLVSMGVVAAALVAAALRP